MPRPKGQEVIAKYDGKYYNARINAPIINDVLVDKDRTWNVQTDDASGTTVSHLIVEEIQE